MFVQLSTPTATTRENNFGEGKFNHLIKNSLLLNQKMEQISSDFIVLQFWSPFCEPCGTEVKELNLFLQNRVGLNGSKAKITVLGIPVQSRQREIQAFIDHYQPQYDQWFPDRAFNEAFYKLEGTVPLTILLRKGKRLLREWRGTVSARDLRMAIVQANDPSVTTKK